MKIAASTRMQGFNKTQLMIISSANGLFWCQYVEPWDGFQTMWRIHMDQLMH